MRDGSAARTVHEPAAGGRDAGEGASGAPLRATDVAEAELTALRIARDPSALKGTAGWRCRGTTPFTPRSSGASRRLLSSTAEGREGGRDLRHCTPR